MRIISLFFIFLLLFSSHIFGQAKEIPLRSPEEEKQAMLEVLKKDDFAFTRAVRAAYLRYGESVCRKALGSKINDATWKWIKKRPEIMSAVCSATDEINPTILLNLQRMLLPLGQHKAPNWIQFALAYAIRYRGQELPVDRVDEAWDPEKLQKLVAKSGGFAFQTDDDLPKLTDEERALMTWLNGPQSLISTRPRFTIPDLIELPVHEINISASHQLKPPLTKFPNWKNVALAGKIYPLYTNCQPTPQRAMMMKIWRYERYPGRPSFQMDKAEWPILMYLADFDELDETSFLWNWFVTHKGVQAALGLGKAEGLANDTTTLPSFQYRKSKWHPSKTIRIYNGNAADQGGYYFAFGNRACCIPSSPVGAPPGGKFFFTGSAGNYSCSFAGGASPDTATVQFFLDRLESVDPTRPRHGGPSKFEYLDETKLTGKPWQPKSSMIRGAEVFGLAFTLSQGLQEFEDARMAMNLYKMFEKEMDDVKREKLLLSVYFKNPVNSDILYKLAALYCDQQNYDATTKMIAGLRLYIGAVYGKPVTTASRGRGQAEIKNIYKALFPTSKNAPVFKYSPGADTSTDIGWICGVTAQIISRNFKKFPTDGESIRRNSAAIADELAYQRACLGGAKPAIATDLARRIDGITEIAKWYSQDVKKANADDKASNPRSPRDLPGLKGPVKK